MICQQDTIAALATAPQESALGVIRISGPDAMVLADKVFTPSSGPSLSQTPSHRLRVGCLVAEGNSIDQAVVSLFRAPRSYTGEDSVEISTHGNPMILRQVLALLFRHGARPAEPGEFTQRAYLNGRMDLAQAEAVAQLIRAKTESARRAALEQLEGRLSQAVRDLKDESISLLAHIEVGLDHSDDDQPFLADSELALRVEKIQSRLARLTATFRSGKALRDGVKVAIVGKPNVGKSSLLNRLLREDRALVSEVPGTTRDVLKETLDLDGIPLILLDTAGLRRKTSDPVEKLGMERTKTVLSQAELVLSVFDAGAPLTEEDFEVLSLVKEQTEKGAQALLVLNKSDLGPGLEDATLRGAFPTQASVVRVSAKTGAGFEDLESCLKKHSGCDSGDSVIVTSARHQEALRAAGLCLDAARVQAKAGRPELAALEIKESLDELGAIIGETAGEEVLAAVFSQFCIGK